MFYLRLNSRRHAWAALAVLVLAAGCMQTPPSTEKKAIEVVVTTPVADQVTDYQDFTGRLDALKTVEIRARVSGYVNAAPFKEGDEVRQGDVLFEIDPRTYLADLNQAEANLKLAEADSKLQAKNTVRVQRLFRGQALSQEEYDTAVATLNKVEATVKAMEAARDRAKLFVNFTRVLAPASGRVSRRFVDPGNLVNADNTILTTIVTENPLYVYFDVDERTYLGLVESTAPGRKSWLAGPRFPVMMRLANEDDFSRSGLVDFVDNRVNANTGTIRMRAVFDNPSRFLKAGMFVRIRLPIGTSYTALLVPDEAIISDQLRKYAYVVGANNEVAYRPVILGQEIKGLRVIKKGLSDSERVIISGMQRVRPGAQVQAEMQKPPKPPGSPLTRLLTPPPRQVPPK